MNLTIESTIRLNNGLEMPRLGLGVFQAGPGPEVEDAVRWALEAGYRLIDTASVYGNEAGVGRAIRASGLPREEVFLTTKVWNDDQGYDATLAAFEASLDRLAMDAVDLYLVHWPVGGTWPDTWRALETIYRQGRARAIGVSNFLVHHLEPLLEMAEVRPTVNQVEFHPRLQQPDLVAFCQQNEIVVEAWRPIMMGRVLEIPALVEIGEAHGKNAVQVTLRWMLQREAVAIPKSVHQARIEANADLFDFALSDEEMARIERLDRGERLGIHPDEI